MKSKRNDNNNTSKIDKLITSEWKIRTGLLKKSILLLINSYDITIIEKTLTYQKP